jgi:hypothetical protein
MEPRLSGLPGRVVDAPKVNASNINRSKRKKTYRHENACESAVNLHGIITLLKKIRDGGRFLFNTDFVSGRFYCTMIRR